MSNNRPTAQSPVQIRALAPDFFTQIQRLKEHASGRWLSNNKAGKTVGMNEKEMHERLSVCFRPDVPANLPLKYRYWGKPATALRFYKMHTHFNMLAKQRRGRRGYETAVHH